MFTWLYPIPDVENLDDTGLCGKNQDQLCLAIGSKCLPNTFRFRLLDHYGEAALQCSVLAL